MIETTYSFVMHCEACGRQVRVGSHAFFRQSSTGKERTAYFAPEANGPDMEHLVGVSDGGGDTFKCMDCVSPKPYDWV